VKRALIGLVLVLAAATAFAQSKSVYTEDLTWFEIRDMQAAGKTTAIIYAGGTEQNGPHMALAKHNAIAYYVAGKAAEQLGNALVYPIVPFALAGDPIEKTSHARFPGTVTVTSEVFLGLVRQIALSAAAGGFKNIYLLAEHGGGQAEMKLTAENLDTEWKAKGVRVRYIGLTKAAQQISGYLKERKIVDGGHGGVTDTSQVMFLGADKWIRKDKLTAAKGLPEPSTGINADPSPATPEMGKIFLDYKIADVVAQIQAMSSEQKP